MDDKWDEAGVCTARAVQNFPIIIYGDWENFPFGWNWLILNGGRHTGALTFLSGEHERDRSFAAVGKSRRQEIHPTNQQTHTRESLLREGS